MDVCSKNPNRTAPVSEAGLRRDDVPLCSRTNGWSWPPHPFQLLAWLLYLFFAVAGFGLFVPLLPQHWIPAGYICTGVMFVSHLCVHVMAVSMDPADYNVRMKSSRGPLPVFDRSKHAHVIENCHCYLCQVDVGPKSKHCSACNKCVASFDHHCRWLNNCVGRRNYKLFLNSIVSALLGICLVLVSATYVFIQFFLDPSQLRTDMHFQANNDTVWFVFLPVAPVSTAGAAIPSLAAVTIALGLLSGLQLSHLLGFHIYLMWNRLSTYEYIVKQRHRQGTRTRGGSSKAPAVTGVPSANLIKDISYPGTLGYSNPEMGIKEPGTTAPQGEAEFHMNGRVRRGSSGGEEHVATVSNEDKNGSHTQRKKKRKKRVHRAASEINIQNPVEPSSLAAVPLGQNLPFPAFPLRASLPPLAQSPGPVQAAGPPAEYHSDSAESLEEIPVALARLGSWSSSALGGASGALTRALPACIAASPPSPHFMTKRKRKSNREQRFEMSSSKPPSVFVSQASGEQAGPRDNGLGPESWLQASLKHNSTSGSSLA